MTVFIDPVLSEYSSPVSFTGARRMAVGSFVFTRKKRITADRQAKETLRVHPNITADYGVSVKAHERMLPISCKKVSGELIYDFGQDSAVLESRTSVVGWLICLLRFRVLLCIMIRRNVHLWHI